MNPLRILVNVFHPDLGRSRGNLKLLNALEGMDHAVVRDMYTIYPDFVIDVPTEQ
jgi:glutathione-regulated potassium-efflux system ancillary protein KefF